MGNLDILRKAQKTIEKNNKTKLKIDSWENGKLATGWERVSTGSLLLDKAMNGGWAVGRIHTVYGPKNSGKSTTVQIATAQFQKAMPNKIVLDCDAERSREDSYAAKLGVDHNEEKYAKFRPDKAEDFIDYCIELLPTGVVSLIIIDSVKALIPQDVYDGKAGDRTVAAQARMLSDNLAIMAGLAADNGVTILMTNQMRVNVGQMFGNPEKQTGGKATEYTPSLIFKIYGKSDDSVVPQDKNGFPLGYLASYYIEKSRFCNPFQKIEIPVIFGKGYDNIYELIELAKEEGIVERAGSWYKIISEDGNEIDKAQGMNGLREMLKEDNDLFEYIKDRMGGEK